MKKSEYVEKLRAQNRAHINNILKLIKDLNSEIDRLKNSKTLTDNICSKFGVECYSYNLVYEMDESKTKFIKDLESLIKIIQQISDRSSKNIDNDIQKLCGINDLLYTYEVQLNTINRNDLSDIEKLQLNAIKKEIYEKYMRIKAGIDRAKLKEKFDKLQKKNFLMDVIYDFFVIKDKKSMQRENLFVAIKGIDDCVLSYKAKSAPERDYRILDIIADIEIYLSENKKKTKYKEQFDEIIDIKNKIYETFSIDKKELKDAINEKYKSKYPMPIDKNIDKMKKKYQKTMEFLYKSGYIRSYQEVKYNSKMDLLIKKLELLSKNVEREISR